MFSPLPARLQHCKVVTKEGQARAVQLTGVPGTPAGEKQLYGGHLSKEMSSKSWFFKSLSWWKYETAASLTFLRIKLIPENRSNDKPADKDDSASVQKVGGQEFKR